MSNFVQIATIMTFTKSVILATLPYSNICVRTKFGENSKYLHWRPIYGRRTKSKMAAAAILNFQQMLFWPRMANMKRQTKFGAN